ncbi:MAG: 6-pyruvoyl-tetrahydropterin synthase-related protein [Anaerolineales bacterium]|nr:MAG: 6-pyruvoyl-tetrahydropterin synthase-related protein [Anaerolineales bacterium]
MQNKDGFARLVLFTALLFGLIVRLAAPIAASGPVNDGGLFLQMTRDLQANHFVLPETTTYNNSNIPFAYPPLGFYLAGLLQSVLKNSLISIFTYLPAIISTVAILAFYFLARQFVSDSLHASIAALFYALIPKSFDWAVMGGGVTRAPALVFSFLTLAFAYRLFTTKDTRNLLPASICAAALTLSHPEIALQTAFSVFILALFFLRGRKSFFHASAVAALIVTLTSPWWLTVIARHGLAPFQAALGAHPRDFASSLLYLFQFNLSGEVILDVVAMLGLIGLISDFRRRDFFLPAWIGLSFLSDPRAAPFASLTPLLLLAVRGLESTLKGIVLPASASDVFESTFARRVLLGVTAYLFLSGLIFSMQLGNQYRILPAERQTLTWIQQNTPADSRFLVLTDDAALSDPLSEWFPALTERTSLVTVQGHEWTPNFPLRESLREYAEAQSCLNQEISCLSDWDFDYVYIRRVRPNAEGGVAPQISVLEASLRGSEEFVVVYDSDVAVIFSRGKPTSNAIGPRINSHMATPRPNWSARKPRASGRSLASGSVTAPIAMTLAD